MKPHSIACCSHWSFSGTYDRDAWLCSKDYYKTDLICPASNCMSQPLSSRTIITGRCQQKWCAGLLRGSSQEKRAVHATISFFLHSYQLEMTGHEKLNGRVKRQKDPETLKHCYMCHLDVPLQKNKRKTLIFKLQNAFAVSDISICINNQYNWSIDAFLLKQLLMRVVHVSSSPAASQSFIIGFICPTPFLLGETWPPFAELLFFQYET